MPVVGFHRLAWEDLSKVEGGLRGACKANLARLAEMRPGVASGLRLEKVHVEITELKVSWNKQEFRLLFFHLPVRLVCVVSLFQKKTRKTPDSEIKLALKRKKEIELERTIPVSVAVH
jgi:phage-related protein